MVTHRSDPDLNGIRVLVCRPQPRADELCRELADFGARTRALPMMEIEPLPLTGERRSVLLDLDHYQHVICVSPTAAERLIEEMDQWWPQWPLGIQWWGVGSGTARILRQAGLDCRSPQSGHNSEALLAQPALSGESLRHSRVLIVGGEGGRGLLAETLGRRAERQDSLILYRRRCPDYCPQVLQAHFGAFDPQALITLSGETLNNLMRLVQNTPFRLHQRQLIVPVERVAAQARQAGFTDVRVPSGLTAQAIAGCIAGPGQIPQNKDSDPSE
ncbi:MAG: uroporphyrinogen-III synthase [Oleiphilaceae bacterium]|nr:uroporphyrinogen-III synthase [Oleiphilaceae bacterium]